MGGQTVYMTENLFDFLDILDLILWMKVFVAKLGKSENECNADVSLGLKRLHYHACFNKQVLFVKMYVQIY